MYKYIIKNPYSGKLQKPELITTKENLAGGYFSIREYPETDNYDFYEVCLSEKELFNSSEEAYEELVNRLIYKLYFPKSMTICLDSTTKYYSLLLHLEI